MRDECITIALGLPEVRVIREEETVTEIVVEVEYRREWAPCPLLWAEDAQNTQCSPTTEAR